MKFTYNLHSGFSGDVLTLSKYDRPGSKIKHILTLVLKILMPFFDDCIYMYQYLARNLQQFPLNHRLLPY